MSFNTALLFDKPEYSDIIVSYSGRKTFCHKIIICQSSDYFKTICGPGSRFAESMQDTIELKEDDPDAVFHLLRYIYTKQDNCGDRETDYALQLEIAKVAQKYLHPTLHTLADNKFRRLFSAITHPAEIFDAIAHLREASDDTKPLKIADSLEERQTLALLKVPGFRERVEQDKDAMWKYLDEYADFKAGLEEMRMLWCADCGCRTVATIGMSKSLGTTHGLKYCRHDIHTICCWVPKHTDLTQFNKGRDF